MRFFVCHSENFGKRPMDETFALIKALDYDGVDLASRSLAPQPQIVADPEQFAEQIKACAKAHGLILSELFLDAVEVDGRPVDPAEPGVLENAVFWQNFEKICLFAQKAGFKSIMGAPGRQQAGLSFEECFLNAAAVLQHQCEVAQRYGIAMHVEPTRSSLLREPEDALRMVTESAPLLRYTLDFLHYQSNDIPLERSIVLMPYAGHLHIRQARGNGVGKCRIEEGEIDYRAVVAEIARLHWDRDICSELWCSDEQLAAGIRPVEQNIVMRYQFMLLLKEQGIL